MKKQIALAFAALGCVMAATSAQAGGHVSWSVGINVPAVTTVVSSGPMYAPAPVVYEPAPVYVEEPVVYAPPPPRVVYRPVPVVYGAPVVYGPRPVVYGGYYHRGGWHNGWREREWREREWHEHHDRDWDETRRRH